MRYIEVSVYRAADRGELLHLAWDALDVSDPRVKIADVDVDNAEVI